MNPISDFSYFIELLRLYKKIYPDFIFHYTIKPNIYGSFASGLLNIPSAAMIAGLGFVFTGNNLGCKIARLLYKFAMLFPKKILVLNEYNRDVLLSKNIADTKKIVLLKGGEGVNLEKFRN